MAICLQTCALASRPVRHASRPLRVTVTAAARPDDVSTSSTMTPSRRNMLAGIAGAAALAAAPRSASAKSIEAAKRERDARKQAVRDAAAQSREEGRSMDTGLTSDFTLPEGAQRGRNSRTTPQKRTD